MKSLEENTRLYFYDHKIEKYVVVIVVVVFANVGMM